MKIPKKAIWLCAASAAALVAAIAEQNVDITGTIRKEGERISIAIPDFRGAGDAQNFMATFNQTLWNDVNGSALFRMVPKTSYPTFIPQQPSDFSAPPPPEPEPTRKRGGQGIVVPTNGGGRWISDWSGPPASASYLAFGYTAIQGGVFVLRSWLYDLNKPNAASAQLIGKTYTASTADENGARKTAHDFACDIISLAGGKCMFGTHIYYVHQSNFRSPKEIWRMDPDGSNQEQITKFGGWSLGPAVSPDGSKVAFCSQRTDKWAIFVFSVDPVRDLRFYNQNARANEYPSFTQDGKQLVFASTAGTDRCCRIFIANLDGSGVRPISSPGYLDTEPKVNPRTGADIVFSSGRSGPEQIYKMNMDGGDVERLTDGTGEAANPFWHPNGQKIAYAWTRGYATGKFNIFIMDVAGRAYIQLTHDEGKNENPSWAPDGIHLAFMSNRTGTEQIWSMLADGTQPQQLTRQGLNYSPAWGM
jgi:TolB protein